MSVAPTPESSLSNAPPINQELDAEDPMDAYKRHMMNGEQPLKLIRFKSSGAKHTPLSSKKLEATVAAVVEKMNESPRRPGREEDLASAEPPSADLDSEGLHPSSDGQLIDNMCQVHQSIHPNVDTVHDGAHRGGRSVTSRRSATSKRSSMSRRKRGPSLERVIKTTILEQVISFDESHLGEDDPTIDSNSTSTDFILQDLFQTPIAECDMSSVRSGASRCSVSKNENVERPVSTQPTVDLLPPIQSVSADEVGEQMGASRDSVADIRDAEFETPEALICSPKAATEKLLGYSPSLFTPSAPSTNTESPSDSQECSSSNRDLDIFRPENPDWTTFDENPFKESEWPEEDADSVHSPASVADFAGKLHCRSTESAWSRASDCRSKASF